MATLRIQHSVIAFDAWKRAFDADPVGRKSLGVRRYSVHRAVNDPDLVMIDLDFEGVAQADAFLQRLIRLWKGEAQAVVRSPQAWIVETIESVDL